eukprot:3312852-Pleurochrysis_carterae.AAC.6
MGEQHRRVPLRPSTGAAGGPARPPRRLPQPLSRLGGVCMAEGESASSLVREREQASRRHTREEAPKSDERLSNRKERRTAGESQKENSVRQERSSLWGSEGKSLGK